MVRFPSFLRSTNVAARHFRPSRRALTCRSRLARRRDFKSSLATRRLVLPIGVRSFFLIVTILALITNNDNVFEELLAESRYLRQPAHGGLCPITALTILSPTVI